MGADFCIYKSDDDRRLVFGWASIAVRANGTQIEDWQGDVIDPEDLEEAVYEYVLEFRDAGEEHISSLRKKGKLVESVVFTKEKMKAMGIPEGIVPEGWWIGFKVQDDEAWAKVKSGQYSMFSIEGSGVREPVVQKSMSFNDILKFNPNHGADGRFTTGSGFSASEAARMTMQNDGGTFNPRTGESPTKGFSVATAVQNERRIAVDKNDTKETVKQKYTDAIKAYAEEMKGFFKDNPDHFLGTWIDFDGALCLDTPQIFQNEADARRAGIDTDQDAIFDLEHLVEIPLKGVNKGMAEKEKTLVGVIDPRAEDFDKQVDDLADRLAEEAIKRREAYYESLENGEDE